MPSAEETDRLVQAIRLFDEKRYDEARAVLTRLVADEPRNAQAAWNMGLLAMHDEQYDPAVTWFDRAIRIGDADARYHLWRGYAYVKKSEGAVILKRIFLAGRIRRSFERAVVLDPENVKARRALMAFYERAPAILGGGAAKARRQAEAIRDLEQ